MDSLSRMTETTQQCVAASKLLIGLPEGTPIVKYTNMKRLKNIIDSQSHDCYVDSSKSPFLVVTCVRDTFFEDFDKTYPDRGPKISYKLEEGGPIAVLEVMASGVHEVTNARLQLEVGKALEAMGLEYELIGINQKLVESSNKAWKKQADLSYAIAGHTRWPVLVFGTGLSETAKKLAIDAQGWLEAQGSDTQVAITIKIDRHQPNITLQRWELSYPRRMTRSQQPIGAVTQEVRVFYKDGVARATGDLIIPFDKVFRRPKRGRREADISIKKEKLVYMGELIWAEQGLV
ncbi:hypothetical protein MGYG_01377 [Nannizzia gypsea CBS 118893]|uniref:Uncharacterized protein n=1 Tax=Arthroderma gypseum (strain ATCC MYA-4604 / CBS 118893) TaxID=535722 RepID=E5R0K0_ARTGP|nr:hypothetical protein MGYG_01377 [Nannizzia gypsea CBS 118893]EFQ98344.1 hypothetical protein MGYG_01377 [Nannizzia gypsea CBS 118893]